MSLEAHFRCCVLVAGDDQPVLVHTILYCQLQVPSSWDSASSAPLCFALDSPDYIDFFFIISNAVSSGLVWGGISSFRQ